MIIHRPLLFICPLIVAVGSNQAIAISTSAPWMICTNELVLIESNIERMTHEEIVLVDEFGLRRSIPTADLFFAFPQSLPVQKAPDEPITESRPLHFITLVDGQVVQATIERNTDSDFINCTLMTDEQSRGGAMILLEQIRTITLNPEQNSMRIDDDTITTMTGDVLVGFIESIGQTTVIDSGTAIIKLQLDQIESLALANIVEPAPGLYISTIDGMRVLSDDFNFDFSHALSITIESETLGLDENVPTTWLLEPDAAAAVHVVHRSIRIESLASISPEIIEPTGNRSWTPTPTVISSTIDPILSSIDLRAPVRVVYPIPPSTTRFACTLSAPINTWTDCIANVFSHSINGESTLLFSSPINADYPTHELDLMIEPGSQRLEFRIEPGKHGPIQDRVLIEHPRLLIES